MKAIIYTRYGSPDVLQLAEADKPLPQANQVLIKVHAASANPVDWHSMRGAPFMVRMSDGWRHPKDGRIGVDLAGVVEAVGDTVTQFHPGDAVFGRGTGSFAEYVCARVTSVAPKPAALSFEAAAAVPIAALTALQGLQDAGQVQTGQQVLINGASGGVGTFAVQIAKALGAHVTGVSSTGNIELVRSIGADQVIDYTQADFTRSGQHYDVIFDTVGACSIAAYQRALRPQGIALVVGFSSTPKLLNHMILGPMRSRSGKQQIRMFMAQPNQQHLLRIKELLEASKVVPVIDRRYPLAETPEAIRYLEAGHARGKVVITVL
ncbi:MAG: NAD(P)-dependent alcohol dehydrogenase [Ktedonobacterales bacterium]|nr:NAD(P)-dependent alcohol dehydrogenase [Ktedonobacterales bacterium]